MVAAYLSDWEASTFCLRPLHPSAAPFFLSGHHHRRSNLIALFLPQRIHSHQQLVLQSSPSSMGRSGGVTGLEAIVRKEAPVASPRQLRDQPQAPTYFYVAGASFTRPSVVVQTEQHGRIPSLLVRWFRERSNP